MPLKLESVQGVFSYSNLVHAVSGAAGGSVAITTFFPLDTARTRLQVDDHFKARFSPLVIAKIIEKEGPLAVYRGWLPVVKSLWCSNFVYFYAYNSLKAITTPPGVKPYALKDLTLAFIAGVINVLTTTPLWVVNTRLKLQGAKIGKDESRQTPKHHYNGIIDGLYKVARDEGVLALWSGTLPSLVLVGNPSIQFMVYEVLKRYMIRRTNSQELSGATYFCMGAIAKMVATIATYPMQVLQARLRAGYYKDQHGDRGLLVTLLEMFRERGLFGLYKGLEAKLSQTVLMGALMFLTYEKIAAFIFKLMRYQPAVKIKH